MWWNEGKVIKELLEKLTVRLDRIEGQLLEGSQYQHFMSVEESVGCVRDQLNELLNDDKRQKAVELATKTLDKFEDYMKNVDKLNGMINELKGVASMARASVAEIRKSNDGVLPYITAMETKITSALMENSVQLAFMSATLKQAIKAMKAKDKEPAKKKAATRQKA